MQDAREQTVIELRVRGRVERIVSPLGRGLARAGFTPTSLTLIGLTLTLAGAVLIALGRLWEGATVAVVGSALDGLDGSVARATGSASVSGALVDSVADRIGETATWAGLAYFVAGRPVFVLLCVSNLGAALLISYLRAKAESSGVDGRGGLMGRAERVIVFTAGLVFNQVGPMLWAMAALSWLTVGQRFLRTWQRLEA